MLMRFLLVFSLLLLASCASGPDLVTVAEWRTKADEAYRAGQYPVALRHYRKLSEAVPAEAEVWFRLGNTHARMGQTDEAVKAYREAVLRDRQFAKAWYNAGFNQLRASAQTFSEAMQYLPPDDPVFRIAKSYNEQLLQLMEKQNSELVKMSEKENSPTPVDVDKVEMIVLDGKPQKISEMPPAQLPDEMLLLLETQREVMPQQEPLPAAEAVQPKPAGPAVGRQQEEFWHPPLFRKPAAGSGAQP